MRAGGGGASTMSAVNDVGGSAVNDMGGSAMDGMGGADVASTRASAARGGGGNSARGSPRGGGGGGGGVGTNSARGSPRGSVRGSVRASRSSSPTNLNNDLPASDPVPSIHRSPSPPATSPSSEISACLHVKVRDLPVSPSFHGLRSPYLPPSMAFAHPPLPPPAYACPYTRWRLMTCSLGLVGRVRSACIPTWDIISAHLLASPMHLPCISRGAS